MDRRYTRKSKTSTRVDYQGRHRFEHWYRDRQVYFITARVRDRWPAFASEPAKAVFWDRFGRYAGEYGFTPWVTSLLDNHYHTLGYLERGEDLKGMMQRMHGSVAKLVNDLWEPSVGAGMRAEVHTPRRIVPFWRDSGQKNYYDGCIRDIKQCRLAYRYTLLQAVRHGIVRDRRDYPYTHVNVELEQAVSFALERDAFLKGVRYKRYQQ